MKTIILFILLSITISAQVDWNKFDRQLDSAITRASIKTDSTISLYGTWQPGNSEIMGGCYNFSNEPVKTIVGNDTTRNFAPYQAMVILTLLQQYSDYEKECYADSTEECFEMYMKPHIMGYGIKGIKMDTLYSLGCNSIDPGFDANYLGTIKKYIHREPTFKGFIEYLKGRVRR